MFLDGVATQWAGHLESKPNHPVGEHFEEVEERGLLAGACGYCANAFDATEGIEARGIEILGSADEHAPDVGELAETHNLLTIG